jgi:hypothetical protein
VPASVVAGCGGLTSNAGCLPVCRHAAANVAVDTSGPARNTRPLLTRRRRRRRARPAAPSAAAHPKVPDEPEERRQGDRGGHQGGACWCACGVG